MLKDTHKKIALVTISLAGGGAERSTAILSQMLGSQGYQVHIILLTDAIDYAYFGTIYNMGVSKKNGDSLFKKYIRFKNLKKYIKREGFDFIIDNRNRLSAFKERVYLNYIYKNQKVVYVTRSYKLSNYFPENGNVAQQMVDKSTGLVGVSKAISDQINDTYNTKKARTIYNPVQNTPELKTTSEEDYFIFVGRLIDEVKNVSLLINAFAKAKKENYHLKIYGDGKDKEKLEQLVLELQMESFIKFYPFKEDVYVEISSAKALLLTSHYEGFPRVVIEALSVGTPVISVDCDSGPREVIENRKNGLLVVNHNAQAITEAIESFIFDKDLYDECKAYAKESVEHLQTDVIAKQWSAYLDTL